MAESQTGFDMREYRHELDKIGKNVMPDYWPGHGRIKIQERGFNPKAQRYAETLFEKLTDKYPDKDSAWLAGKAIERAEEKF